MSRQPDTLKRYIDIYEGWKRDPEGFWREAAQDIDWIVKPQIIFDETKGIYGRWFSDGVVNTAHNCLDRHVERGRGEQTAVIYDSPMTGQKRHITYRELLSDVATFAGVLREFGIVKGDRVVIYMPMIPETIIAMLACARIGAIHSVIFGGFAAKELAIRIDDAMPKLVISASCGIEPNRLVEYKPLLDQAIALATIKPMGCIIVQREQITATMIAERDHDYASLMKQACETNLSADCEPVQATDPLYLLYTSGTTGKPKGVVRDTGGHMVALKWTMKNHYGIDPGDIFFCASDVGWVVGHSYIVYGPLLQGATTILYEGKPVGTPNAGAFWRVISEHNVKAMFTAPTAFRAIKKENPQLSLLTQYNLSHFRTLFLAGERADANTVQWAQDALNVSVIDHWWQTETGWAICGNCVGIEHQAIKLGSPSFPLPGWDVAVLDDASQQVKPGETGSFAIRLPLPPGAAPTLWQNDERFTSSYLTDHPGYYKTADAGYIDEDGYVFVMARTDDIINVAGHRLSTGTLEEAISSHPDIAECAVVGAADAIKGQVPVGFVVLKTGVDRDEDMIKQQIIALVRDCVGPVASFKIVYVVNRLPKTRSGKILRNVMKKIVDREVFIMPPTIDDCDILTEISQLVDKK